MLKTGQRVYQIYKEDGFVTVINKASRFAVRQSYRSVYGPIYARNKSYADTNPCKILWVDPNQITHESRSRMKEVLGSKPFDEPNVVYSGRWDKDCRKFAEKYVPQSLRLRFNQGYDWTETPYYAKRKQTIQQKGSWRGLSSEEELLNYLRELDELYERIKSEGYKTQTELLASRPSETRELNNDAPDPELNEIGVNIGRDGKFIWQFRGQHRLAIAQLLDIDEVPVQVLTRHSKWQRLRRKMQSADSVDGKTQQFHTHPDISEVT